MSNGKALFIKYWYASCNPVYKITSLPGWKEGVSGSVSNSINIGINPYSSDQKIKAAIEAIKYITSKEIQKRYIISNQQFSAITNIYNEDEVCYMIDCEVPRGAHPFSSAKFNDTGLVNYEIYVNHYRSYIYEYLYMNKPLEEIIKKIDDMTKIYKFSIHTDDSSAGLVIFIIFCVTSTIIGLSIILLFTKRFIYHFRTLPIIFWIFKIYGPLIILISVLTFYGEITSFKCKLRVVLLFTGMCLYLFPIIYYLIINFPEDNKISTFALEKKYKCLFISLMVAFMLIGLLFALPYNIKNIINNDGENYVKCDEFESYGKILMIIIIICFVLIILIILLLIFLEWNLRENSSYIKQYLAIIFITSLFTFVYVLFNRFNINNYILYNTFQTSVIIFSSISIYLFIFIVRLMNEYLYIEKDDDLKNSKNTIKESTSKINNELFSKGSTYNFNNNIDSIIKYGSEISVSHSRLSFKSMSDITEILISIHNKNMKN